MEISEHKSMENSEHEFYTNAVHYWSEIPATVDGMMGGFGYVSQIDIKGSKMLLKHLFNSKDHPGRNYALDCGAGIGRITKFLLTDIFEKVDMVEQNEAFLDQAEKYLGRKFSKIGHVYPQGLQNFQPEEGKYDVIWIQWVLGHLTHKDLVNFLSACRCGLKKNGVIVVKENITSSHNIEKDEKDSSVTWPLQQYHIMFQEAKLHCYRQVKQHNFPKGLLPIYMFILKPKEDISNSSSETNLILENNEVCENIKPDSKNNISSDLEKKIELTSVDNAEELEENNVKDLLKPSIST